MGNLFNREPALFIGAIRAALVLFVLFGVNLTPEQMAGILIFSEAVLSLIVRHNVSPTKGN